MSARDRRRLGVACAVVASVVVAAWHSGTEPGALADTGGWASFRALLASLSTPDLSPAFLARIGELALESLLIGALGTALAVALALALALAAARVPALVDDPADRPGRRWARAGVRAAARGLLAVFRSVPEIVWAFLFVRLLGLGPGAAVLAIAIVFAGIIGKLFAELIEAADPEPARRLRAQGAGPVAVFVYGVLPLVRRPWTAYALFRLECAIRSASILGIVGAGGLGQEIELSLRYFQNDKLATALLAVLAYVVLLELASLGLRRARTGWSVATLAGAGLAGLALLPIPWRDLFDRTSLEQARLFLAGLTDPRLEGAFVWEAVQLALITVSMAWVATVIAAAFALPLAPLATTRFTVRGYLDDAPRGRGWTRWLFVGLLVPARLVLQISRALPELLWALLFIVWVGPGVTAGVLALTVHTIGVLGRLYGDALEDTEPDPPRALEASGAGPLPRYLYGVLPQTLPRMLSFTLFRFEVNVRAAAMVGFVGAGGLGDALHTAISLFHLRDLATLLLTLFAVVLVADAVGDRLRRRLLDDRPPAAGRA